MSTLTVEAIPVEQPYSVLLLHTGSYPLAEGPTGAAKAFALSMLESASPERSGRIVLLQHEYLRNGKTEFNAHLQEWRPESGLGVWPDRAAPSLWTTADLFRMLRGESVPLMYRVLRLASPHAAGDALERMMGTGMVMAIAHNGSADALLQAYKKQYLPGITQPNLRIFPFYVPLLDVKSVRGRHAAQLNDWLGNARLYLRESPEDKGLLMITNLDLEPLLARSGIHKDSRGVLSIR